VNLHQEHRFEREVGGKLSGSNHYGQNAMVFLAITAAGLADALRSARPDDAVWCGSDAITEPDQAALKHPNLSRFIYELGDRQLISDAISTIEEHHPGHTIWVEGKRLTV
jgi:hypothetical protein